MNFDSYIVSETKTALSVPMPQEILPKKKTFKQKAFTLAETLITLSIIGVVAAMTVPTLISNMNKQTYVTGLKKAYSNIQNAVKMMPISVGCSPGDYSCVSTDEHNYFRINAQIFANQFQIGNDFHICKEKYPITSYSSGSSTCFQSTDGTVYLFANDGSSTDDIYTASIGVDVNGYKGPNKYGRDVFMFAITKEGKIVPHGSQEFVDNVDGGSGFLWQKNCTSESVKKQTYEATACTARVLQENAMNY